MLTEVGVDADRAVGRRPLASRSGRASGPRSRWPGGASTAREAAKQARRLVVPGGRPSWRRTADVAALLAGADLAVVLHEEASVPLAGARRARRRAGSWSWSAPRAASPTTRWPRFVAAGAAAVRLGAEVLRTSTAGVAAVAALLSRTPRWT